jgi:hypothetical protein
MHSPPIFNASKRRTRSGGRVATVTAFAAILVTACSANCPPGTVEQGKFCRKADALTADAGADTDAASQPESSGSGGMNHATAGGGGTTGRVGASGAGGSKAPPIDPTIEWMCMKNAAGECTSCKQDGDCPKHICEQGFCMDCRDASQCGAADSCISNRCVPERKPSSIWTTAAGGQTSAAGFKVQLSVGTPSPATSASAAGYKVSVAPGGGLY